MEAGGGGGLAPAELPAEMQNPPPLTTVHDAHAPESAWSWHSVTLGTLELGVLAVSGVPVLGRTETSGISNATPTLPHRRHISQEKFPSLGCPEVDLSWRTYPDEIPAERNTYTPTTTI